jgi:hypothetical protein
MEIFRKVVGERVLKHGKSEHTLCCGHKQVHKEVFLGRMGPDGMFVKCELCSCQDQNPSNTSENLKRDGD